MVAQTLEIFYGDKTEIIQDDGISLQLTFKDKEGNILEHSIISINKLCKLLNKRTNLGFQKAVRENLLVMGNTVNLSVVPLSDLKIPRRADQETDRVIKNLLKELDKHSVNPPRKSFSFHLQMARKSFRLALKAFFSKS